MLNLPIAIPFFFYFGPRKESIFFDHHLQSIFQSSLHTYYILQSLTCWTSVGSFPCTASTPIRWQLLRQHQRNVSNEYSWSSPLWYHINMCPERYSNMGPSVCLNLNLRQRLSPLSHHGQIHSISCYNLALRILVCLLCVSAELNRIVFECN